MLLEAVRQSLESAPPANTHEEDWISEYAVAGTGNEVALPLAPPLPHATTEAGEAPVSPPSPRAPGMREELASAPGPTGDANAAPAAAVSPDSQDAASPASLVGSDAQPLVLGQGGHSPDSSPGRGDRSPLPSCPALTSDGEEEEEEEEEACSGHSATRETIGSKTLASRSLFMGAAHFDDAVSFDSMAARKSPTHSLLSSSPGHSP
jgi:hypothetical protein